MGAATYDSGADDKVIRLGSINSLTGLVGDQFQPRGARAFVKHLNERGGINGRRLELIIYDDQWDTARAAALVRQAFEKDKVFAFVSNQEPLSGHGTMAYITGNKVPVIGGDMINLQTWGKNEWFYPTTYLESQAGGRLAGRWAVQSGCQRVGGMAVAVDESRSWVSAFEQGLKDGGLSGFTYKVEVSFAETDYTPYVAAMKGRNIDCATFGFGSDAQLRLRKAIKQQNYQLRLLHPGAGYDPLIKDNIDLFEGDFTLLGTDIFENADSNPAVGEMLAAMKKYEPGAKLSGYTMHAWVSAKLAAEVLRRAGNVLTRANLKTLLDNLKDFDTGLTPGNIGFNPGPHSGGTCGNVVIVEHGDYRIAKRNYCL